MEKVAATSKQTKQNTSKQLETSCRITGRENMTSISALQIAAV
jgi:hypothetical protein